MSKNVNMIRNNKPYSKTQKPHKLNAGPTRKKTDINNPAVIEFFNSLKTLSSDPCGNNIIASLCKLTEADVRNLIPEDVVIRTQNSMKLMHEIYDNAIFSAGGGGMGMLRVLGGNKEPESLDAPQESSSGNSSEGRSRALLDVVHGKVHSEMSGNNGSRSNGDSINNSINNDPFDKIIHGNNSNI